jgi:transglutaminase-like putative cysteine protease
MVVALVSLAWFTGDAPRGLLLASVALAGHVFSWRRRHRDARLTHLALLLALTVAFSLSRGELINVFSGGWFLLLGQFLALALALVSFGLRSRRNLYDVHALSLTVLLLMGLQAFSLWYLGFLLAFALITAGFLWASHLPHDGERTQRVAFPGTSTAVKLGALGAGGVLLVAVTVYIILPQSHRVTAAGPLPSRLDLTSGWPPPPSGRPGGDWAPWAQFLPSRGDLSLALAQDQPTAADAAAYLGLGYTGDRGDNTVLYVRSPLASFWRGLTLDVYDGHGWVASSASVRLLVDSRGRLRFADAPARFGAADTYLQSYFLRVAQPNALFTGYTPGLVDLGRGEASPFVRGPTGYLRSLREATAYRVLSAVPRLTPAMLRDDVADRSDEAYLSLPAVPARVKELAQRIVAGAATDYDKAARLERFLLAEYPYDLRVPPFPREGDAVDFFLFDAQAGYCSQFATALAVMGRLVGLPTRVAVGYLPGAYDSLLGVHAVRLQDAHAWVEVRFREHGWVPFDPTPAPNSPWATGFGSSSLAAGFQQTLRRYLGGILLDAPASVLSGVKGSLGIGLGLVLAIGGLVALASLLLALPWALRRRRGVDRNAHRYAPLAGEARERVRRAYREALRRLERHGFPARRPHQGAAEYLTAMAEGRSNPEPAFVEITALVSAASYDPRHFPDALAERAHRLLGELARDGLRPRHEPSRSSPEAK